MCNDSPKVPYKMQNPEVRSSRNQNFGNNMEALQNAKPGAFFSMKKWFWYKMYGPGGISRTKYWSKPVFYQTRVNVFRRGNSNPDYLITSYIKKTHLTT